MLVNDKGIVVGNNKDVATAYQEGLANGFGEDRCDLFKKLLKAIITDNAEYTRDGKIKLKTTVKAIFDYHVDKKPMCFTCKSEEKYVSTAVDNFKNWIGEWEDEKISIHSTTPSSSYIIKDRAKLIDFLLYFNHKQYIGTFKERVAKFESDLSKFGFSDGALYIMRWHDFCVRAAFKLAKDDENVYELFYRIYNNQDFKDIKSAPATQIEIDEYEEFTNNIMLDFNNINEYGSIDDSPSRNVDDPLTLYQFVRLHRLAFDRAHLSSYKILCDIILNEKLPENLTNERWEEWEDEDRESIHRSVLNKISENDCFLRKIFDQACESTYGEFLNKYREALVKCRISDYRSEISDKHLKTVFDSMIAAEECREFLKLEGVSGFSEGWATADTDPSSINNDLKIKLHERCERFFFAAIESGEGRDSQNTWINQEIENSDIIWDSLFYRGESVSKELMIWTLILCLNSEGLKGYCTRSELGNPESIAKKIIFKINKILGIVGMSLLNGNFSEAEFLLVNAIYHIDYKKLYNSQKTYYPFREYVLNIRNSAV